MLKNVFFAVFLTLAPTYALADSITFGALSEATVTTHTEGAFTYTQSLGSGWSLSGLFGNPASGLLTKDNFTDFGSTIDIFLTGGGLFTFNSFQIACAGISGDIPGDSFDACDFDSEAVQFIGKVGASTLFTSPLFSSSSFPPIFSTVPSGTALQFDRLQIRISRAGTGRQVLDNINLTPIPIGAVAEPGTLLLLVSGLAGLTGMGFSRSRKK